jgi:exoribonuclease II
MTEKHFHSIRAELHVCESFSSDLLSAARALEAVTPAEERVDRTDIPLFTIDPPGSVDLDQALWIDDVGSALRLYYAIADVGAFIDAAPEIEAEAWKRGVTAYSPDKKYGLYPSTLSEGAASLLADGKARPAFLFTADVDTHSGNVVNFDVQRATVLSRRKMSYEEAQVCTQSMLWQSRIVVSRIESLWYPFCRKQDEIHSYGCLPLLERLGKLRQAHALCRGSAQVCGYTSRSSADEYSHYPFPSS